MSGDEKDSMRVVSVRQWHAHRNGRSHAGGDAVGDFYLQTESAQMSKLFTIATEHEWVAALESHDALAASRLGDHQANSSR